jgi:site-specific DNA recombinase
MCTQQAELLELASSKADYEDVADEIYHLRDQKQKLQGENANRDELKKRMADMSTFLASFFLSLKVRIKFINVRIFKHVPVLKSTCYPLR